MGEAQQVHANWPQQCTPQVCFFFTCWPNYFDEGHFRTKPAIGNA